MMERVYNNLNDLLENEDRAKGYYAMLPDFVQNTLCGKGQSISSFNSLCDHAEAAFGENKLKSRNRQTRDVFPVFFNIESYASHGCRCVAPPHPIGTRP